MIRRVTGLVTALALLFCAVGALAAQVLEDGSSGETVSVLSKRLCDLGYLQEISSEYDETVAQAVSDFQTANDLDVTGVADIDTQKKMNASAAVTREQFMAAFSARYQGKRLQAGNSGDEVKMLQTALAEAGFYDYPADGEFGEGTRRAVAEYQRANGLEATGVADGPTLLRLYEGQSVTREEFEQSCCAEKGDSGAKVKTIQDRLNQLGYFVGETTGTYGENTQSAVAEFQENNDLEKTGSVDYATYEKLFSQQAVRVLKEESLGLGDRGEAVFALQQRLLELGIYESAPSAVYDRETQTAVMLFCAANGLDIPVGAPAEVQRAIYDRESRGEESVPALNPPLNGDVLSAMCAAARAMEGEDFSKGTESLFPGYGFARYLFATRGLEMGTPAQVMERLTESGDLAGEMAAGDIVVLEQEGDKEKVMRFYLCVDKGILAGLDEGGQVILAGAGETAYTRAYLWKMGQ